jgi:hypothetical protein
MKRTQSFIAGFVLAIVLLSSINALAGIATFKTDLIAAFTNNFLAADRQRVANAFVNAYPAEWQARVAAGTADTSANRGDFAADKIIEYIKVVVKATEQNSAVSAVPTPTPLPN